MAAVFLAPHFFYKLLKQFWAPTSSLSGVVESWNSKFIMSKWWTMVAASGSLIRSTNLNDTSLQGHLCSARWQKSSTGTKLLKFGTKLVQYVVYRMLKKSHWVVDENFDLFEKFDFWYPNFEYWKKRSCLLCFEILAVKTRNLHWL